MTQELETSKLVARIVMVLIAAVVLAAAQVGPASATISPLHRGSDHAVASYDFFMPWGSCSGYQVVVIYSATGGWIEVEAGGRGYIRSIPGRVAGLIFDGGDVRRPISSVEVSTFGLHDAFIWWWNCS